MASCITSRAEFPWEQARRLRFPSHGTHTHTHTLSGLNTEHLSPAVTVICLNLSICGCCRTEIFSGKTVTHDDISYEQACILYNLGQSSFCFFTTLFTASRFAIINTEFQLVTHTKKPQVKVIHCWRKAAGRLRPRRQLVHAGRCSCA